MSIKILADGSNCPHAASCIKSRLITILASVVAAAATAYLSGCAFRWQGLGVEFQYATQQVTNVTTQPALPTPPAPPAPVK